MRTKEMNILFTSSGRRVSLIQEFIKTFQEDGLPGRVITADLKVTAPTAFISDRHYIVPRVNGDQYLEALMDICLKERITAIIPLIDTELELLAMNRAIFERHGVKLLLSSCELNEISANKKNTYKFFRENNIPTPKVYTDEEIEQKLYKFPLIIKPRNGSSSQGVTKIHNEQELHFFRAYIPQAMVQEYVTGEEYTIDAMVDFEGNIKTIVPRLRIETRAGEVSKGVTKKDAAIIEAAEQLVRKLPGAVGCITLQCFKQPDGEITFIEINPRFGGGVPLSIEAGARFPRWTVDILNGESFNETDYTWKDNLMMMRYDEAIFKRDVPYGC